MQLLHQNQTNLQDIAINDIIIGSVFHAIRVFYASRFAQMKTEQLHVIESDCVKQSLLWVNQRVNDYILSPITNRDDVHLSNRDITALILKVPLTIDSAWDTMMNVRHQLWKISSSQEAKVVQRWLQFWGWLPRSVGDACFSSFTYISFVFISSRRGSFSVSIVPGPMEKTALASNPILSLIHASPPVGNEGCHFSIMCYNNQVQSNQSPQQITLSIVADECVMNEDDLSSLLNLCNSSLTSIHQHCEEQRQRIIIIRLFNKQLNLNTNSEPLQQLHQAHEANSANGDVMRTEEPHN